MQIQSILSPARTLCCAPGSSKKRVIENIAHFICQDSPELDPDQVFESLVAREKLGSTGLGQGIAIPHCRIKSCHGIVGALITLDQPTDFDAIDNRPVDILFVLLVPEEATDEHLQVLSELARQFSNSDYCRHLREADCDQSLYQAALTSKQ